MHALYFCHRNSERSSRGFLKFCLSWVYLIQVEIVVGGRQSITFLFFWAQALEQFVEDVVVALVGRVSHDPRFFQEILGDLGPGDRSTTSREETSISNCFCFVFFSLFFLDAIDPVITTALGGMGNYNSLSKENLRVFAETRRVVVADGCGVAEAFQQR